MATLVLTPGDPGSVFDETCVVNGAVRLMAYDPNGNADFPELNPKAEYVDSGTIVFRNLNLRAVIDTFFGSEGAYKLPVGTSMRWHFSFDGGATYSGYITTSPEFVFSWFDPGDAPLPEVLTIKLEFFSSADKKQTPELSRFLLYADTDYDVVEDAVRTLKRAIRDNLNPKVRFWFTHAGGNTLTLKSRLVTSTLGIYKENERDEVNNLVQSYNPTTNEVTLIGSVAAGARLELRGTMAWATDPDEKGALQVRVRPQPDYIKSHTPLFVVRHIESNYYTDGALAGDETEKRFGFTQDDRKGRVIERPLPVDLLLAVDAVAEREAEAYAMCRAVRDLLKRDDKEGIWQSYGMGYFFDIVDVTPLTDVSIPEDEFHDLQVRAIFGGKEYQSSRIEAPLAESIEIQIGNDEIVEVEG